MSPWLERHMNLRRRCSCGVARACEARSYGRADRSPGLPRFWVHNVHGMESRRATARQCQASLYGRGGLEQESKDVIRLFAGLCLVSLVSYIAFSEAVVAFLDRSSILLTRLLEIAA